MALAKQYLPAQTHRKLLGAIAVGVSAITAITTGCSTIRIDAKGATTETKIHVPSGVSEYMKRTPDEERHRLVISIPDQRMALLDGERVVREYSISTALKGASEALNSDGTPRGLHVIAEKIGDGQPVGMIFKGREPIGVISELNPTEGIPPVVTRLFRLRGLEAGNQTTYDRLIYLHGSPHEAQLGQPASGGCIRMKSDDVIALFNTIEIGTPITILEMGLSGAIAATLDQQKRYVTVRRSAEAEANAPNGGAVAMHNLCFGHTYGVEGIAQNFPAALRWCELAGNRASASSLTLLAELNEHGRGTPLNLTSARALYERAASLNHPYATARLAYMQQRGLGGPTDVEEAQRNSDRALSMAKQANTQRPPQAESDPPHKARDDRRPRESQHQSTQ